MIEFTASESRPKFRFVGRYIPHDLDRTVVLQLVGENRYLLAMESSSGSRCYAGLGGNPVRVFSLDSDLDLVEMAECALEASLRLVRFSSLNLDLSPQPEAEAQAESST
jgi:hypothetical protein